VLTDSSGPDRSPGLNAVVFDLGGVLIDWDPRYLYRTLFPDPVEMERFLGEVCTQDWHEQHDRGRPMRETIPELTRDHPEFADHIAAWARQAEMYGGAFPENVEILSSLRGRTRLLALTNWPSETFELIRSRFDFLSWFEGIVVSGEEGIAKPDPEIFERLADRFRLVPAQTLFIDDSSRHVAAARSLGYQIHHFQGSPDLRGRLVRSGLLD
jgi:2-haloacid dehalogenase